MADTVVILKSGQVVAKGTSAALKRQYSVLLSKKFYELTRAFSYSRSYPSPPASGYRLTVSADRAENLPVVEDFVRSNVKTTAMVCLVPIQMVVKNLLSVMLLDDDVVFDSMRVAR